MPPDRSRKISVSWYDGRHEVLVGEREYRHPAARSAWIDCREVLITDDAFTVSFEVPADIKSATLVVAPTQVRCQVSTGNYQARPSSGEAKIQVTIPEK